MGPAPAPQNVNTFQFNPQQPTSTCNNLHPTLTTKYSDMLTRNNSQLAALATHHVNPPLAEQTLHGLKCGSRTRPAPHQPEITRTTKYSDILTRKNPRVAGPANRTCQPAPRRPLVCVCVCVSAAIGKNMLNPNLTVLNLSYVNLILFI